MTGYLLDTNTALIALTTPDTLSPAVRTAVLGGPNILFLLGSAAQEHGREFASRRSAHLVARHARTPGC